MESLKLVQPLFPCSPHIHVFDIQNGNCPLRERELNGSSVVGANTQNYFLKLRNENNVIQ